MTDNRFAPGTVRRNSDIYSVSRLNREVRGVLTDHFSTIWVEGELSNLARPSSGHLYFTLKDSSAQVRCALFRMQRRTLGFSPKEGDQVLVKAQVGLYEPRGDYQLLVERMEESGDGALRRAFEALKQRLFDEGLFDAERKQPIPPLPQQIGVITSPSGAAIHDILTVLKRRFPALPVIVYPVPVQGEEAKIRIARAIAIADRRQECDVLILARGGGSLEDLWAFNEEILARAIDECTIPIITGIGHEIDVTIADFVADLRAATPSAAAEAVSPEQSEWLAQLNGQMLRLRRCMTARLEQECKTVGWLDKRLQQVHPGQRMQQQAQRLDELEQRLRHGIAARLRQHAARLGTQTANLRSINPLHRLQALQSRQQLLWQRLQEGLNRCFQRRRHRLTELSRALDTVSPLATLSRGYAIISRCDDSSIVCSYKQVQPGAEVEARLAEGHLICRVEASRGSDDSNPSS